MDRDRLDILIVDDDELFRAELLHVLRSERLAVDACGNLAQARRALAARRPAVVLLDIQLPDGSGIDLLKELQREETRPEVVIVSGAATLQEAADSVKLGATDFLEKPFDPQRLLSSTQQALRVARLSAANRRLIAGRLAEVELVGSSAPMRRLREQVRRIAATDARVLITGESGTGKELVAGQIHYLSPRSERAFVRVNCSAMPRDLVESELFGHERGAFTGAVKSRRGRFTQADGGTLLLDEIGDMPVAAQPKLLRALETGEVEAVGAAGATRVDVRLISATHRDLDALASAGEFRADLLYRINAVPIAVPPLREHREDIPELVEHFLDKLTLRDPSVRRALAPAALEPLIAHDWPGNVRQLRNVVERLFYTASSETVTREEAAACLGEPDSLSGVDPEGASSSDPAEGANRLAAAVQRFETGFLRAELDRHDGNVSRLAASLGMDRGNLYRKLKRLGLLSP